MTDSALDASERKAHEACPCRLPLLAETAAALGCPDACDCSVQRFARRQRPAYPPCTWKGHALIRDLRREAFNDGMETAAQIVLAHGRHIIDPELDCLASHIRRALAEAADGD